MKIIDKLKLMADCEERNNNRWNEYTLFYSKEYANTDLYVTVIKKGGKWYGKWAFDDFKAYQPLEIEHLPYHVDCNDELGAVMERGKTLVDTFKMGNLRYWLLDKVV